MASTITRTNETNSLFEKSLGVVRRPQTYRNLLYVALAFPLGLAYFVSLTTGFALGLGLSITLVGIPLLLACLVATRSLTAFERWLANTLLDVEIPRQPVIPTASEEGYWPRFKATLTAPSTWTGLVYLYARFATGLVSFVLVVVSFSLTAALVTAPLTYNDPFTTFVVGTVVIDTLTEALLAVPVGIVVGIASLHVVNIAAWLSGKFAIALLHR